MFGLLLSGRLVDTGFREVDASHAVIDILDVNPFNHVVVFLTGQQPFPDGMGGAVYFSWPDPAAPPTWQFLGSITNAKPSAIFKVCLSFNYLFVLAFYFYFFVFWHLVQKTVLYQEKCFLVFFRTHARQNVAFE